MTVVTSIVPALKDAIIDGLRYRPAWADIQCLTEPPGDNARLNRLWLTTESSDRSIKTMGGPTARIQETGSVGFAIAVERDGTGENTSRAARNAAYALLSDLDAFLASDYGVGIAAVTTVKVGSVNGAAYIREGGGRVHELTGLFSFNATLTPGG